MLKFANIDVTGDDAFEFLQGQLTNDLKRLESATEIRAAWCSPKGRVLWFGALRKADTGYSLVAPAETAAEIVKRLTVFRFRAKVDFNVIDEQDTADPTALIEQGLPWIGQSQMEAFTPHMLNLDLLDAVSLDKGCYTGQEIVARTHYKGATKRRTFRFSSDAPVAEGARVSAGDRNVGEVLNACGHQLLAVVPADRATAALTVDETRLSHVPLPYLEFKK